MPGKGQKDGKQQPDSVEATPAVDANVGSKLADDKTQAAYHLDEIKKAAIGDAPAAPLKSYRPGGTTASAEEGPCGATLRVRVFDYGEVAHGQNTGPFEDDFRLFDNVKVCISGDDYVGCKFTNNLGEAVWDDLPPGDYDISASPSGRYNPPKMFAGNTSVAANDFHLNAGQERLLDIGFVAQIGTIEVMAFLDHRRNGNPDGQPPLNNVTFDFLKDGELIACIPSEMQGLASFTTTLSGKFYIRPRASVRVDGQTYRSAVNGPIIVNLAPGGVVNINAAYVASLADVELAAKLITKDDDGDEVEKALPGVKFDIYRGSKAGVPVRTTRTNGYERAQVGDLEADDYVIVAQAPKTFDGRAIEFLEPPNGVLNLHIESGDHLDLTDEFKLRLASCKVRGLVTNGECGSGVAGVVVLLKPSSGVGETLRAVSDEDGQVVFDDVVHDDYFWSVEGQKVTTVGGAVLEHSYHSVFKSEQQRLLRVKGTNTLLPEIQFTEGEHRISGRVLTQAGVPIPHAVVEIQDEKGNVIEQVVADDNGQYQWVAERAGQFYVVAQQSAFGTPATRRPIRVNQSQDGQDIIIPNPFNIPTTPSPPPPINGNIASALEDIGAYPILTEQVSPAGFGSGATAAGGGAGGGVNLGQTVNRALAEVLGRNLKAADPVAVVASLERAFTPEQVNGRTVYHWTPRSYAVQTELGGAITGAQASIYHRAKVALDDALPLLDGLEPLLPDFDPQEVEAVRSIVRTEFIELVNELGVEGGPTVQRVDDLFTILRNRLDATKANSLPLVFGFDQSHVIRVEEEQNLTNFLVIRDYVEGLFATWQAIRGQFTGGGGQPFLGTQLVLLSRALSVVAEQVNETRFTMDSVFLGPAERRTVRITFPVTVLVNGLPEPIMPDGTVPPSMLVEDLLGWIERFATDEGPELIREGGRRGVQALEPVAARLSRLVLGASQANVPNIGFNRPRVRRSLADLAFQIAEVARLSLEVVT